MNEDERKKSEKHRAPQLRNPPEVKPGKRKELSKEEKKNCSFFLELLAHFLWELLEDVLSLENQTKIWLVA